MPQALQKQHRIRKPSRAAERFLYHQLSPPTSTTIVPPATCERRVAVVPQPLHLGSAPPPGWQCASALASCRFLHRLPVSCIALLPILASLLANLWLPQIPANFRHGAERQASANKTKPQRDSLSGALPRRIRARGSTIATKGASRHGDSMSCFIR
jgi:hypothetical protein